MKLNKSTAALDYKLVTAFKDVRRELLQSRFADRLDKPLAHWVIGSDRRLPLAFLDRSLRELLNTPFDDLFATAGIGHKKIRTFLMLLHRAAKPHPPGALRGLEPEMAETQLAAPAMIKGVPSAEVVSEALWVRWRESVRRHGLEREPLGRFVETLIDLPRVVWHKPLGDYTELRLAQVRSLRTHGEKRVRAVLEVFGALHRMLLHLDPTSRLAVRIVPRWLIPIEDVLMRWLNQVGSPSKQEINKWLIAPLLEQVRVDAGPTVARLVESRLKSHARAVRQAADRMGLTRARIYQLLSEASEVITVRWPAGAVLVAQLHEKLKNDGADAELLAWLDEVRELLFLRGQSRTTDDSEVAGNGKARHGRVSSPNGAGTNGHHSNGHGGSAKTNPRPAATGRLPR
ncbi:MAG TPA: hypothetical protein VFW87_14215 [Pirellulales bacterium]|nr:hypothetical protein [Pirellulales bacterium]